MCFSKEASFTLGTVLIAIGCFALKKTKKPNLKLIAAVPLLFGFQQIAEGVVWQTIHEIHSGQLAMYLYLFFAWIFWPLYVPIAYWLAEQNKWRQYICILSFIMGLYVAYVDTQFLLSYDVTPKVVGKSLSYPTTTVLENLLYASSTLPPIIFSSIPYMWLFGTFLAFSFSVTQVIWTFTFTSVWCFFASLASLLLLKILVLNNEATKST